MSDVSQGAGWWQASDGRWYPPHLASGAQEVQPSPAPPTGPTSSSRRVPLWVTLTGIVVAAIGGYMAGAAGDNDSPETAATNQPADRTTTTDGGERERTTSSTVRETTTTRSAVEAVDALSMASFGGLAPPAIPAGAAGEVSVVAQAAVLDSSGSLALVIRNMTRDPIAAIEVTGIARDSSGGVVASGASQGFSPVLVRPGEIALGYVYFELDLAGQALAYELQVSSRAPDDLFTENAGLVFAEFNPLPSGPAGVVKNEGEDEAAFAAVQVVCFDDQGVPTRSDRSYADPSEIPPGGSAGFKVDLYGGGCAHYLAAAG